MGGRGTFASGNPVPYSYEINCEFDFAPDGKWEGVKILKGSNGTGKHGLPESSHYSEAYLKFNPDGTFRELRLYDKSHILYLEIAYHPEKSITGNNHENVLHFHTYDTKFSKNKTGPFNRSAAQKLTKEMEEKYNKYLAGILC